MTEIRSLRRSFECWPYTVKRISYCVIMRWAQPHLYLSIYKFRLFIGWDYVAEDE